jgi:hypothetical protein
MLFQPFGVSAEKAYCGSIRARSATHVAVVRLELLEDRFLLSGEPGMSRAKNTLGVSALVFIDTHRHAARAVSAAVPMANESVSEPPSSEDGSDAGGVPGPAAPQGATVPNEPQNSGSWGPDSPAFCAQVASGSGSSQGNGAPQGGGDATATPSQPVSISFSPTGQNSQISVPSPTPPGIPAGGIFQQGSAHANGANISVLYLDPVVVDLSSPSLASASSPRFAAAVTGGQPTSLAAQPAAPTLGLGVVKRLLGPSIDSTQRSVAAATTAARLRQRAELPDVAALAPVVVPETRNADVVGSIAAKPSDDLLSQRPNENEPTIALTAFPGGPLSINQLEAEFFTNELGEKQLPANMVIYSAASLMVGVSAPGMTSLVRRGKRRSLGASRRSFAW